MMLCAIWATSCSQSSPGPGAGPATTSEAPEVQPPDGPAVPVTMAPHISVQFAIYSLPEPTHEPLAELDKLLQTEPTPFRRVDQTEREPESPCLAARIESDPKTEYAPPDMQSLQYFGRGLTREQAEALQDTKAVLILDFAYPAEGAWDSLRSALALTRSLAETTGGLIWDEATREVFSPEAWNERRLAPWKDGVPDISKHVAIHAYNDGDHVRVVTLGMEKFGLPDVVVEKFSWSLNRNMGHVVNLFIQAIAEGAPLSVPGNFDLDMRSIKNDQVREPQVTSLMPNATGVALLRLRTGTRDEGDPANRLIAIGFDRGAGPDIYAKQESVLAKAFGTVDALTMVKHNEAIEAASRAARRKLPDLRADFNAGLEPGEFIMLKAPFKTKDGGREFMWVEVMSWNGDRIKGLLKNEPEHVPELHAGQSVDIAEHDVFDFIRKRADGTSEGNETGKLIEKAAR